MGPPPRHISRLFLSHPSHSSTTVNRSFEAAGVGLGGAQPIPFPRRKMEGGDRGTPERLRRSVKEAKR